jgi:2,4-dienoyl-CoA reductase-like NADH-dependent reductase (Old Yellow Enzyme family)/thioredoxin reductase
MDPTNQINSTGSKMKFEHLFKPGRIGSLELKNRIVMLPMGTVLCGVWGEVTHEIVDWYATRAKGGVGLIIVEVCVAATAIDPLRLISRILRADDDSYIPGLAYLADAVHENGAKIGIQLTAGGGAQSSGGPWMPGLQGVQKIDQVSPSGVPAYGVAMHGTVRQPRALAIEEIEKCVELCGDSALRVKKAGFDLIEIHAHEGYLIAQFMSPYFNKRTDKYGGSLENRCRFLMEIVAAMRKATGPDFPLVVKYSIDEFIPGGRDIKESQTIAKMLEEAGVSGLSCSIGVYGSKVPPVPPYYIPRGNLVYLTEAIKQVVKLPVMAVGRLDDPELAEEILRDGKGDFIGIGRGFIADPEWPLKVQNDRISEIRKCIACNDCRIAIHTPHPIRCAVNPVAGRESKFETIRPAEVRKKVVIVGGGPAGMEAARVAALMGHQVLLFEAENELGGMLKWGSVPPHKEILGSIPEYYSGEFKRLGVKLRLGVKATLELIIKENPDSVIVATGGVVLMPDIPGIDKGMVMTALDVLSGKKKTGENVVVAGGGAVGCEVANYLAQQNKKVAIVEMLDMVGLDMDSWIWVCLSAELAGKNVRILKSTKIEQITGEGVVLIDKNWNKTFLKADNVVLALGLKPFDRLAKELEGKVKKVSVIGDAKQPRRIQEAIYEGFLTADNL